MKRILALATVVLMILSCVPIVSFAGANGVTENSPVTMPKADPVIDGSLENDIDDGYWSSPAKFNEQTVGYFWGGNKLTCEGNLYYAYSTKGLYFACDMTDNDEDSGFALSTGLDDVNPSGSKKPYGFNGDVVILMLDPLGDFEKNSSYIAPWYCVGMFANDEVRVYRSNINEGEITSQVQAAGKITDYGFVFEVFIPWSIICEDIADGSDYDVEKTPSAYYSMSKTHRAAVMYMDRVPEGATWGRYITVCNKTYDGYSGTVTSGTNNKAFGLKLVTGAQAHIHNWSSWSYTTPVSCLTDGVREHTCIDCKKTVSETVKATGHGNYTYKTNNPSCTTNGSYNTYCGNCKTLMSSETLRALGHDLGQWQTVKQATSTSCGLQTRSCSRCTYEESNIIPTIGAPEITFENFTLYVGDAENIDYIRVAPGVMTNTADIKTAEGMIPFNATYISKNTSNGKVTVNLPDACVYSVAVRMTNGSWYISSFDNSYMEQSVTSNGVMMTVSNLAGVNDYFILKGDYSDASFDDIKANYIARIKGGALTSKKSYTYTLSEPGLYTVYIRYTDLSRAEKVILHTLTVTEPNFVYDGLQVKLSNLTGVKSVRYAYGDYTTMAQIKSAPDVKSFSAKSALKATPFTLQLKDEGLVSISVEYTNGYKKIVQYDVVKKKPKVVERGCDIHLYNLDDLYIIRYAKGTYTDAKNIKATPGAKYIKPAAVKNGTYTIALTEGETYTVFVQYNDNSMNFLYITPDNTPSADKIVNVGSDRQVLVEDYAIDYEYSTATLNYIEPVKKGNVFSFSAGYEATDAVYHNIVKLPNGTYRMYYKATDASGVRRICYITSTNGTTWTRPNVGTYYYGGSSYNNIVTSDSISPDNLFVFYDTNPNYTGTKKWKGIYGQWGDGLYLEYSTNGNDFFNSGTDTLLGTPSATGGCFYDTLNTVYYDSLRGKYVAFVRGFHQGDNYSLTKTYVAENGSKVTRDIRYSESTDGKTWSKPVPLKYDDGLDIQMYANAITPYYRAAQLYVGLPTKYSMLGKTSTAITEVYLMSSRDLVNWDRSDKPYMTPDGEGSYYYYGQSGYPCVGIIQTSAKEMSVYMKEPASGGGNMVLYRYALRIDGFREAAGTNEASELVTKYMNYTGSSLEINYKTGTNGKIRVTAKDVEGNKLVSDWFQGDEIAKTVTFDKELSTLASGPIQLSFELDNASIYSFKFN